MNPDDLFSNMPRTEPGYLKSREYYSDEFIQVLSEEYEFDPTDINVLTEIYEIAHRYVVGNDIAAGDKEYLPGHRKQLLKLQKKFLAFKDELEAQGGEYFNLEVSYGARQSGDLNPELDPDDYPGKNFSKNGCYWFEFERYMTFFDVGLDHTIQKNTPRGGRPRNEGLHLSITYIADFWEFDLKRKYTVDHHEGHGLTEAFEFTKKMLSPLDDIEDVQIITAMRCEIKERRELYTKEFILNKLGQKTG